VTSIGNFAHHQQAASHQQIQTTALQSVVKRVIQLNNNNKYTVVQQKVGVQSVNNG
jgi:hypothetical protein